MNFSFTIRQSTPEDARGIAEVHVQTWRDAYEGLMPAEVLDGLSVDDREATWTEEIDGDGDREVWVTEHDGEVVGFCSFGPSRDDDSQAGEVYALYVAPDFQEKWMGHSLLKAAETRLGDLGFEESTLWVLEDHEATRGFYEACEWSTDGTTETREWNEAPMEVVQYRK